MHTSLNQIPRLSCSRTGNGGMIRSPWGGRPSYNSMMLESFTRAGEKALRVGPSWTGIGDRRAWGGFTNIVTGWDAVEANTGIDRADVTEYDLTIDYKPLSGRSSGLWLRLRGAYAEFEDDTDRWNARLILNYSFNLL